VERDRSKSRFRLRGLAKIDRVTCFSELTDLMKLSYTKLISKLSPITVQVIEQRKAGGIGLLVLWTPTLRMVKLVEMG